MSSSLAFKDRYFRVERSDIESDTSDSIVFASIPDDVPTKLIAEWTGKQFTKLFSALFTGAHLMFPEEAGEIIWQLVKVVHQPIPIDSEDTGGCIDYPLSSPFISFEPQNPYNTPDLVPDGYLLPPFHRNSDFDYPAEFGFLASDILVPPDAIPVFGDWGDVIGLGFPTIKLSVKGQGQIEWDFIALQLGGYVVVKVGSPPNIFDLVDGIIETGVSIIDLQSDIESLPIESDLIVEHETPIDSEDLIDVYAVFIPKVSASLDFFGMGGGIRQVGLCGLETESEGMGIEDIRFDETTRYIQVRIGGEWIDKIDTGFMFRWSNPYVQDVRLNQITDTDAIFVEYYTEYQDTPEWRETTPALGIGDIFTLSTVYEDMQENIEAALDVAYNAANDAQNALDVAEIAADTADSAVLVNEEQASTLSDHETRIAALEAEDGIDSLAIWSQEFDFETSEADWDNGVQWDTGRGWLLSNANQGINYANSLNIYDARITHIEVVTERANGTGFATYNAEFPVTDNQQVIRVGNTSGVLITNWMQINPITSQYSPEFNLAIPSGNTVYIHKIVVWGRGVNPFI